MIIGVPVETYPGERRVALVPGVLPDLARAGLQVIVQTGAGQRAGFSDHAYQKQGARLVAARAELFAEAEILLQVHPPSEKDDSPDLALLRPGQILVGLLNPLAAPLYARALAEKQVTSFALELLPRISRAQPMDALSSVATIAGYKAVLLAAAALPKMCPMMITAAGTIPPARVLVVGAGVAGLQAIAAARRLGAVVYAYDVRPAVKEQVESLGARFLELPLEAEQAETEGGYARAMDEEFYRRQRALMKRAVMESDLVITTAAIPGKKAPVLITEEAVKTMQPGSIIVDLAAETGGNCELTRAGEERHSDGVLILGPLNLASTVPHHASQMYARNLSAFLRNLVPEGTLKLDLEDPILSDTLLTHRGEVVNARVRDLLNPPPSRPTPDERSV